MAARWVHVVHVLLVLWVGVGVSFGTGPDPELGRMELRRVRSLASHPRYGECWARALQDLDTRCRELTAESQARLALRFTHCHLSSSGRDFPSCLEGSEVSSCTAKMDATAFSTFTEFFTHAHAICNFLQSEAWQSRAERSMHRLSESSAGVAEQLESTRHLAEDLIEAQSAALQAQQEILSNGEELRATLRDSTEGLRSIFSELHSVSRQQQVALSELFNRVSFLQSFLLTETHSLSSCCYNAAGLCVAFLLTSTRRSARARLVLLSLVCVNFYLERRIYLSVMGSERPEHQQMELFVVYVSALRRIMVCVGVCVLLWTCARYTDPVQQSLQVLQELRQTQRSLQEALHKAESLRGRQREEAELHRKMKSMREEELMVRAEKPENCSFLEAPPPDVSALTQHSDSGWTDFNLLSSTVDASKYISPNAAVRGRSPGRRSCGPSLLVYNVLVEDKQVHDGLVTA
ncbi:uncharacterized protein LOC114466606 [Gouania willdenowi]|nr:uncharacterized protein LOC114466606 [Gouania willdenowi]